MATRIQLPDLLPRALAGDEEAWVSLVQTHTPLVLRMALRTGLSRAEAEDVAQSVWIELLEKGHGIRSAHALPRWLAVISWRTAVNIRRGAVPTEELPEDLEAAAPGVDEMLAEEEEIRRVRWAMKELPPRCRSLIQRLFEEEKPDYRSIARDLGVPMGSIGPTRARCLARLKGVLGSLD